jgi:hypothetical protein
VSIAFILKVKAIFNMSFLFNKSFWGVFKVPSVNIYGIRVLRLREGLNRGLQGCYIISRSGFWC